MTRRIAIVALGLLALIIGLPRAACAQGAGAAITGVVVSTDGQTPVRRATVTLTGGGMPTNLSVLTDDAGRFRFVDLTAGRYALKVSKPAFLPMAYGATRPGQQGTTIVMTPGKTMNVRLTMPRGAVITGTVRDQSGQPLSGLPVTISRADQMNAANGYITGADAPVTDDRGVYRAFGLMPGEYVVSVLHRPGGTGELFLLTQASVDARMRTLEQRFGSGAAASASVAPASAATPAVAISGPGTDAPYGYAPIYSPGTPMATAAAIIRVAAGEERAGIDVVFSPVRAARVSGVIQGTGNISPDRIAPVMTVYGPPQSSLAAPSPSAPLPDGSFTFTNVTPGRYLLMARTGDGAIMRSADGRGAGMRNPGMASLFAMLDVTVDGHDIGGLTLVMRPTMSLAGRVAFDATALKPPDQLTALRVLLSAIGRPRGADGVMEIVGVGAGSPPLATVSADGSFQLTGILPGTYSIESAPPAAPTGGPGWWLRSVMIDGRDILDTPLVLDSSSSDLSGAVLTFSDRHSGLHGTLTTAAAQPASEYTVVVFPADRASWRTGARRVKSTRPDTDGAFTLNDLPPGDYLLATFAGAQPDDWQQASFLEQLVAASVKVTVPEGQQIKWDLRIAR